MNTTNNHSQNMSIENLPNSEPSLQGNVVVGSSSPRGKEEKPILTIIIPTYNMEKYLRHCLDSLIVPNMDKVEVLVINDGSKDSSSAIGHEYQDKYPQTFRVIDKENGNYGSCVNRSLKEATGKYVKVLDADDSFDKGTFKTFIEKLQNIDSDLVLTDFVTVDEEGKVTSKSVYSESYQNIPLGKVFDFVDFINQPDYTFYGQMHGLTYRTKLIRDMDYHQTEGISYTDQEWVFMPVTRVKTCVYLPGGLYLYLVGREGQTVKSYAKSINQIEKVIESMIAYYNSNEANVRLYKKYLLGQLKYQVMLMYIRALYEKSLSLEMLREFDLHLKEYPNIYHLVDDVFDGFPLYFKYITYWRNHQQKGLSPILLKIYKYGEMIAQPLRKIKHRIKGLMKFK